MRATLQVAAVLLGIAAILVPVAWARRHHLEVRDDYRRYIALSTFGFYQGGILDVHFGQFHVPAGHESDVFGLSLDKTMTDAMNPYLDSHQDRCILDERAAEQRRGPIAFFVMNLKEKKVIVNCSRDWPHAFFYKSKSEIVALSKQPKPYETNLYAPLRRRRAVASDDPDLVPISADNKCSQVQLDLKSELQKDGSHIYSIDFVMWIPTKDEEGLYNLYFHACPNYQWQTPGVSLHFNVDIEESNRGSFLSAGEMPLPALYFMMSILFLLSGLFWVFILHKSKHTVFKIHYIMAGLVFLKASSLMFHSINFHFIELLGEHVETWAILFYIAHLLKGAVLFITIVLIGTGYTFIKHILSDKDKRLFMIVIPLQILANIAQIIIAEGEEGDKEHRTWKNILYFVDLLCCGAILFPVVWSMRHLQEASATDGKAAQNLRKLKLFRQFYVMIVSYIYLTRIVAYLLRITVPFQYGWLDEMFREMATYVFFVLTAYKFRPTGTHPYFAVVQDDDDDDDGDEDVEAGGGGGAERRGGAEEDVEFEGYGTDGEEATADGRKEKEAKALTRSGLLGPTVRNTKVHNRNWPLIPPLDTEYTTLKDLKQQRTGTASLLLGDERHETPAADVFLRRSSAANLDALDSIGDDGDDDVRVYDREERARLIAKRESSHEYD